MSEILSIGELLDLGNSAATAGLVPYSALEYDGTGRISGISGSAIAGGVDSAVVSSIVSSYVSSKVDQSAFDDCCSSVQSALSDKLDASASGQFQPSGEYYSASNPSGFITSADLSSKLDASASSQFQPSGDYVYESSYSSFSGDTVNNISSLSSIVSAISSETGNIPFSALEYDENSAITAISGSSIGGGQGGIEYTGVSPINVNNTNHEISVSSTPLAADSATMSEYDQDGVHYFAVKSGVFAKTGDLSGYVPVSSISAQSSQWNKISSLSSYALSSSLSAYVAKSAISANSATWNTVSGMIPYSALEYDADSAITAISGSSIGADITNVIPYSALEYNGARISGISGSAIDADPWHVTASSISANYKRADIDGLQVFYTPKTVTGVYFDPSSTGETGSAVGVTVNVYSIPYGAELITVPDVSTSFAPIPAECYRSATGVREWTITGSMYTAHRFLYATEVGLTNPYDTSTYSAEHIYTSDELTNGDPYTIYAPWSASSIIVCESGIYGYTPAYISGSSTVSVDYANIKKYGNDSAVVVPDFGNINTALLSADPNYFTVTNTTFGTSAINLLSMYNTGRTLGYVSSRNSAFDTITITAEQSSLAIDNIVTNINSSRCLDISLLISSPYSSLWTLVQVDDTYHHKTLAFCSVPSGNSATVQMHAYTYGFSDWNHEVNQYANKDTYIEVYGVPTGTVITAHTAIVQMTDGPRSMKYFIP